jgi:pyruvate kinase
MRRTKIVCTIGPSTSTSQAIRALIEGGMDIARINMSHGEHETHAETIACLRRTAEELDRNLGILVDLAGPKVRVCGLTEALVLEPGQTITIAKESSDHISDISVTSFEWFKALIPGDPVLLDDGALELSFIESVESTTPRAVFEVVRGGILTEGKGVNIPNVNVESVSLTEKDLVDLEFALSKGVEYIGLSFVLSAADVLRLKDKIAGKTLIVAKIEKAKAMESLDEIVDSTDALMVARGDLGVELPFERVPRAQKRIIRWGNFVARPVITATQMLGSMIDHSRPTRAEVSDVANAILDGSDAVMLSGETAIGKHPIKALEAMVSIIQEVESSGFLEQGPLYGTFSGTHKRGGATPREHAVASATVEVARQLEVPAVIVITHNGFSARLVSSYRPKAPLFAVCIDSYTCRQLAAVWGVYPILAEDIEVSYEALSQFGKQVVLERKLGVSGDSIVVTAGVPFNISGTTNTMRVEVL